MHFETHEEVMGYVGALRALREAGPRIVLIHGERRLTGHQCLALVYQIARVFGAIGIAEGTAVAMLSMNLPEAYLGQLACQLVGARYTPLHPLGSLDDHVYVLDDADVEFLLYDPRLFSDRVEDLRQAAAVTHTYALGPDGTNADLLAAASTHCDAPLAPASLRGGDIDTIYYTGGTTGQPKGVVHTRFGMWYTQLMMVGTHDPSRDSRPHRMLICTPISHAGGTAITPAVMRGGTVILLDKFHPAEFLRTIEREQVTSTFLVPTMIYLLLDYLRGDPNIDLSSLEEVVYGAAPMSPVRLREAIETIGPVFVQGYGQTEAGVGVLRLPKHDHRLDRPDLLSSAGRPMVGVAAAILREDGTRAAVGEIGELCLRGPMVMKGYWKNPELTARALRGGWLHTDDMAFEDSQGYVTIVDRRKDMIISGGFNVYPSEVEKTLAEHPGVQASAVIGIPDDKWGEAVKAFVVLKNPSTVSAKELIAYVREHKGAVNTPKALEFVAVLPLTPVGKIDRKALRHCNN